MCCVDGKEWRESLNKRFDRNGGKLYLWKILDDTRPITAFRGHPVKAGWNKCEVQNRYDPKKPKGFHVFLSKSKAEDYLKIGAGRVFLNGRIVLVRVLVHKKDLVAADWDEAAFSKMFVPKTELEKAK